MSLQKTLVSIFTVIIPCSFTIAAYASGTLTEASLGSQQTINNSNTTADSVISYGKLFMNRPYRFGSSGSDSFDCSGFTSFVYRNFGYSLTHSSAAQSTQFDTVKRTNLRKGDLVYFSGSRRSHRVGHVGIVTEVRDNGQFSFIHAANNKGITISNSDEPYYSSRFIKANRVLGGLQLAAANPDVKEDAEEDDSFYPVQPATRTQNVKRTTPAQYHRVKSGETLSDIADKYNLSVTELKKLNHLKNNKLSLKQNLKVKEAETYTEVVEVKQDPATTVEGESTTHKVKKGESLYSIAKQYGTTVDELKKMNNIPGGIHAGQELIIKQATTTAEVKESSPVKRTHKVISGESLYSIAKLYNVSPEELRKSNPGISAGIRAGQTLEIPAIEAQPEQGKQELVAQQSSATSQPAASIKSIQNQTREEARSVKVPEYKGELNDKNSRILQHKVHPGENMSTISRDFKVPLDELLALNNTQSTRLEVGQTIQIRVPIPTNTVKPSSKSNLPIVLGSNKEEAVQLPELPQTSTPVASAGNMVHEEKNSISPATQERATQSYTVLRHDNLSAIARKYNMTLSEIRDLNGLKNNHITPGKQVLVYASASNKPVASQKVSEPAATKQDSYTVRKGDILSEIAKRFNLTNTELKNMNGMKDNKVHVGQVLIVNPAAAQTAESKPSKTSSTEKPTFYTVHKGDNLDVIARKYNLTAEELKSLNNLQSSKISAGQKLMVAGTPESQRTQTASTPQKASYSTTDYTVKKGDNLDVIARKHNLTVEELKTLNDMQSNKISAGQKLKVPASATTERNPSANSATQNSSATSSEYTVKKGDNLDVIARKHNLTVEELKALNNMQSNKISAGQKLKVTGNAIAQTSNSHKKENQATTEYTIKKGDNLDVIARNSNMSVEEIKQLNGLTSNKITAGQVIKLSESSTGATSPKGQPEEKKAESKNIAAKGENHEVRKGESLYTIARDYNMTVDELKELNNIQNSDIKPGQTLIVGKNNKTTKKQEARKSKGKTTKYTVKGGDSFYTIAQKFNCSVSDLKEWNNSRGDKIKPGDELTIKE